MVDIGTTLLTTAQTTHWSNTIFRLERQTRFSTASRGFSRIAVGVWMDSIQDMPNTLSLVWCPGLTFASIS